MHLVKVFFQSVTNTAINLLSSTSLNFSVSSSPPDPTMASRLQVLPWSKCVQVIRCNTQLQLFKMHKHRMLTQELPENIGHHFLPSDFCWLLELRDEEYSKHGIYCPYVANGCILFVLPNPVLLRLHQSLVLPWTKFVEDIRCNIGCCPLMQICPRGSFNTSFFVFINCWFSPEPNSFSPSDSSV